MFKEFREFAMRGNVVDLAIGVIIGGAFGTVVNSLVNDILMPPIGLLVNGVDFSSIVLPIAPERVVNGETLPAVTLNIGAFINAVIAFLIIAWAVFLLVKGMNTLNRKAEEPPPAPPTTSEKLLAEIRDLLKR